MASSSSSPQQPPPTTTDYADPPLGVPLLLPAPPLQPPPPPSSRRLPPPCWTPDETSALIDAYREKWYSLRRGNLRAAHWQDVAEQIHRLCPNVSPPKTAVQCRHKMEKLRKRYRAELHRAKSIPHHRFSSSWLYFSKMDSMEKGSNSQNPPSSANNNNLVSSSVVVADELVNDGFDEDDDDDNNNNDDVNDEDYRGGSFHKRNGLRIRIANNSRKNYGGFQHQSSNLNPNPNPNPNSKFGYKSRFSEFSTPPQFEERPRFAPRFVNNGGSSGGGGSGAGSGGSGLSSMGMNMGMGMNLMKKKRSALGKKRGREREKGDKVATEMVEAIRVLGDGFIRMEMMKMEMIRENERVRMENEMKRTQMFLQSQHNLIEGFIKGWSDLIANNRDDDDDDDDHHNNNNNTTKDAS